MLWKRNDEGVDLMQNDQKFLYLCEINLCLDANESLYNFLIKNMEAIPHYVQCRFVTWRWPVAMNASNFVEK